MARPKKTTKKRSSQKILDAFQIAERAENGYNNSDENSDDGDDLQVHDGIMDARKFLGKQKNANDELDDEEILSDEALGSDDDFDILNSKFSQTLRDKRKKEKQKLQNKRKGYEQEEESEDEDEEYNSIDESELVPLSQAWDMDEKDLSKTMKSNKSNDVELDDAWESESSEDEDDEDDESEEDDEDDDDEDDDEDIFEDEDAMDDDINLANTVSRLQSQLKKPEKERKKLISETTDENEYNLPTNGNKLSLNDMIAAVDSSISKDAILIDEATFDNEGKQKSKALSAPLPKNIQDRNDRRVAYDITKEQVSKWQKAVEANLDADHLQFPMNQVSKSTTGNTFKAEETPSTELEQKVHDVLKQSALLDEKNESTFEEIAVAKLSKEDMRKRTSELRLMRELMFRDEKRAKRLKKIKSKQFHKIKKKERIRNQALVEGSDVESDPEDHDMKRAQERMSLKHKVQSKWAQSMIKSGMSKDAENRGELEAMLRQGEKLRSKQLGYQEGDQSDGNVSDIEKEYERDDQTLDQDQLSRQKLGKGVLGMDFMKAADERQRQENFKELELLRKLKNGEDVEEFETNTNSAVSLNKNEGRRIYTPSSTSMAPEIEELNKNTLEEIENDNAKSLDNKLNKKFNQYNNVRVQDSEEKAIQVQDDERTIDEDKNANVESNPWLTSSDEPTQKSKSVNKVDQTSSKLSKSAAKIAKVSNKRSISTRDKEDDNIIEIEETIALNRAGVHDSDEEEDDDVESKSGDVRMFKQKNLIKEAFAGDDVIKEFQDEKNLVIEDEGDKEEDLTLPGWGGWTGEGIKKQKPNKKFIRKIDGVVQEHKRRDKDKKDVIINEKVNKKNLKFQSAAVPYPFETREQYERSLRMPIGQQWTSKETHQKLTKPRIIKKQGQVIDPMKAPF